MNFLAQAQPLTLWAVFLTAASAVLGTYGLVLCAVLCSRVVNWLRAHDHPDLAAALEKAEAFGETMIEAYQHAHQGDPEHPAAIKLLQVAAENGALDHPGLMRALEAPPPSGNV